MTDTTSLENKAEILADFWNTYKYDAQFTDFFQYNDLGLPLAYAISVGMVASTPHAEMFIEETFDLLLEAFGIEKDTGFDTIEDLIILRQ